MSSSENMKTDPVCQQDSNTNSQIDQQQLRFYRVYADIGEVILSVITGKIFAILCKRASLAIQASWIPTHGYGDTNAVALLMNMDPRGVRELGNRNNLPVLKPGNERIYHFPDLVKQFGPTEKSDADTTDNPTNEYQKHTTRKRNGRK